MKTKRNDFEFHMLPKDQGQICEISYAVDFESNLLFKRHLDRSDNSESFFVAEIADLGGEFEPWNGELPDHGPWSVYTGSAQ